MKSVNLRLCCFSPRYVSVWRNSHTEAIIIFIWFILYINMAISITIEFSGGAELLFDNKKKHDVELPPGQKWSIRTLLPWIQDNMLKERPELFIQGDTVRPGILVLVNDADWELMGELEYEIQPNDKIVFISTLHGG